MTVFFAGTELEDFEDTVVGTASESTSSTLYNSSNSRKTTGFSGTEDTNYMEPIMSSAAGEIWLHAVHWTNTGTSGRRIIKFYNGTTPLIALARDTTNERLTIQKWDGSAWQALGTTGNLTYPNNPGLHRIDVHIILGNPGTVVVYFNEAIIGGDNSFDLTFPGGATTIDRVRFGTSNNSSLAYWSEIIVADWNTLFSKIVSRAPDANGNYTGWAGAYTDIDEATGGSDVISSNTNDQRESFSLADFPALATGEVIAGFGIGLAATRDAVGPQQLNMFQRISGTDYDKSDRTLNASTTRRKDFWENSPATAAAYTVAELNGSEIGVRARA